MYFLCSDNMYFSTALCSLSVDSMDAAQNVKSPSLFAVAKLLETGLVNMDR